MLCGVWVGWFGVILFVYLLVFNDEYENVSF